jgi:hypothetical protein
MSMLARSIVGSPDTVRSGMDTLIAETGADELMIVSDVYDHTTPAALPRPHRQCRKDCLLTLSLLSKEFFGGSIDPSRIFALARHRPAVL